MCKIYNLVFSGYIIKYKNNDGCCVFDVIFSPSIITASLLVVQECLNTFVLKQILPLRCSAICDIICRPAVCFQLYIYHVPVISFCFFCVPSSAF